MTEMSFQYEDVYDPSTAIKGTMLLMERLALRQDHIASISHHDAEIQVAKIRAETYRHAAAAVEKAWNAR